MARYWVFSCNPRKWDLQKFLLSGISKDSFRLSKGTEKRIHIGDKGYILLGNDGRNKKMREYNGGLLKKLEAGVYAEVEIISDPVDQVLEDNQFYNTPQFGQNFINRKYVYLKYSKNLLLQPILRQTIRTSKNLSNNLTNRQQESSREINEQIFNDIQSLIGSYSAPDIDELLIESLEKLDSEDIIRLLEEKLKYQDINTKRKMVSVIERSAYAETLKKHMNYECMICKQLNLQTNTFKKYRNNAYGERYVEAHHVEFVSNLVRGSNAPSNIAILCPVHHRQIHYGDGSFREINVDEFEVQIDGKSPIRISKITGKKASSTRAMNQELMKTIRSNETDIEKRERVQNILRRNLGEINFIPGQPGDCKEKLVVWGLPPYIEKRKDVAIWFTKMCEHLERCKTNKEAIIYIANWEEWIPSDFARCLDAAKERGVKITCYVLTDKGFKKHSLERKH